MLSNVDDAGFDDAATLRRLERAENFPVALRILPNRVRADLRAVYDVARLVDDVGDAPELPLEHRRRLLDRVERDLLAVHAGAPGELPVVRALVPAMRAQRLPVEPFLALVEANRVDLGTRRYPTYDDLRGYCRLSADPVGRLVLAVFGVADATAAARSDDVCTALQVLEHCQDVAEDRRDHDRIYLPLEDLERFGVAEDALDAATASPPLRRLVGFEVDRAAALLTASGPPLVSSLRGWARVAVAGYVAGGLATVDALRRADHDVLATTPRPRRGDVARHALTLVRGRRS